MLHKTVLADATASDLGEFTALAATYSLDRHNEQIKPGAFAKTISRWQASGKMIPLHWNHSGKAADIIGHVDPASVREQETGLFVRGRLDLEGSEVAREAWRSMRVNAVSLSFGYVTDDSHKRRDGVTELRAVDLFEVSIVPAPANADTRILSTKSADRGPRSEDELRLACLGILATPDTPQREAMRRALGMGEVTGAPATKTAALADPDKARRASTANAARAVTTTEFEVSS